MTSLEFEGEVCDPGRVCFLGVGYATGLGEEAEAEFGVGGDGGDDLGGGAGDEGGGDC